MLAPTPFLPDSPTRVFVGGFPHWIKLQGLPFPEVLIL